jgi:PAS domain S-box-containing protein
MVIVNNELKITRFTPTVRHFFQLTTSDYGHVITSIPTEVSLPDMRRMLMSVIEEGKERDHELNLDGGRFLMRITPYMSEFARPVGAMVTFTDLTHIQSAELALKESNDTLRAVLDNVFDGIIVADEKGTIEAFNAAAEKIFGYPGEEVVGQNVTLLQPEPYRSEHDGYIRAYLKTGQAKIIGTGRKVNGKRKNGSTFPMDLAITEMWLSGRRKFVGIIRDLTLHQKEELIA